MMKRKIGLLQATSINMIDMVGIGPFVVASLVIADFGNPLFFWAWLLGAVVAFFDSMIWSELGAAYPLAGGSYNFLKIAYGPKWGRLASFLFVWQTSIQAPLVVASGAIGFSQYITYLAELPRWALTLVPGVVILLITALLYRRIESIGKISVVLWTAVLLTIGWIIVSGIAHNPTRYTPFPSSTTDFFQGAFWLSLGNATVRTMYSYLGYYNVCHLGGEIVNPQKNIPRSIFISVAGISVLYLCMNLSIVHVVPWQEAAQSKFVVSRFFEIRYGPWAAKIATALVLCVAFSSLFAVLLGYSRVPYAAAADGNFFKFFSKLHPTKDFPHRSLLFIAGLAVIFAYLFSLKTVISAILAMRILVQFMAQAVGVVLLRKKYGSKSLPFRMWFYPLPVILSLICWAFIFFHTGRAAQYGIGLMLAGVFVFYRIQWFRGSLPVNKP